MWVFVRTFENSSCAASPTVQAKRILDNLNNNAGNAFAAGLLQSRMLECEAAYHLSSPSLDGLGFNDIRGYVKLTESLWPAYPLPLQCQVACRHIAEDLKFATLALKGSDHAKCKDHLSAAVAKLSLPGPDSPMEVFNGNEPLLGTMLLSLLKSAKQAHAAASFEMDIERLMQLGEGVADAVGVEAKAG